MSTGVDWCRDKLNNNNKFLRVFFLVTLHGFGWVLLGVVSARSWIQVTVSVQVRIRISGFAFVQVSALASEG